jgi:hypothetical protein
MHSFSICTLTCSCLTKQIDVINIIPPTEIKKKSGILSWNYASLTIESRYFLGFTQNVSINFV